MPKILSVNIHLFLFIYFFNLFDDHTPCQSKTFKKELKQRWVTITRTSTVSYKFLQVFVCTQLIIPSPGHQVHGFLSHTSHGRGKDRIPFFFQKTDNEGRQPQKLPCPLGFHGLLLFHFFTFLNFSV